VTGRLGGVRSLSAGPGARRDRGSHGGGHRDGGPGARRAATWSRGEGASARRPALSRCRTRAGGLDDLAGLWARDPADGRLVL
jgi:hypothetical protein